MTNTDEGERKMYERTYGYLYDGKRSAKDDAALIRRSIKGLVSGEMLPKDWKFSVRYRSFAGGCSIDITATSPRTVYLMTPGYYAAAPDRDRRLTLAIDGEWQPCQIRKGDQWRVTVADVISPEAQAVSDTLKDLLAGCNHDGSEIQSDYFDVKFYGNVSIDTMLGVSEYERNVSYLPASVNR